MWVQAKTFGLNIYVVISSTKITKITKSFKLYE